MPVYRIDPNPYRVSYGTTIGILLFAIGIVVGIYSLYLRFVLMQGFRGSSWYAPCCMYTEATSSRNSKVSGLNLLATSSNFKSVIIGADPRSLCS